MAVVTGSGLNKLIRRAEKEYAGCEFPSVRCYNSMSTYRKVIRWVLPEELTQEFCNGRERPSRACSLICVQLAYHLYSEGVLFPKLAKSLWNGTTEAYTAANFHKRLTHFPCYVPPKPLRAVYNAIVDGNDKADREREKYLREGNPPKMAYTVEEAIELMGNQMKLQGMVEIEDAEALQDVLQKTVEALEFELHGWRQIFFLLGGGEHCTFICYQPKEMTYTFVDTDRSNANINNPQPAVLAMCLSKDLADFAQYIYGHCRCATDLTLHWIVPAKKILFAPIMPRNFEHDYLSIWTIGGNPVTSNSQASNATRSLAFH